MIAGIAGALILWLSPIYALIVYLASVVWYPAYCTVKLGTIDFSVSRMVVMVLYAKILLGTDLAKRFRWIWLDKIMLIYFAAQIVSNFGAPSLSELLENRAGAAFDMLLPYFAVRLIVQDRRQYLTLLKGVLIIAAPLAIMGFYQCVTGHNPVGFLRRYHAWNVKSVTLGYVPRMRYGFYRADVTFPMSIMYGLFFAMLGPVCCGLLRKGGTIKLLCFAGVILMGIGVFASMSSGPYLAAVIAAMFIAFYRFRRYWKLVLGTIIVMSLAVEIISNRHFYDVLCRFTLSESASWYRSKLITVAFDGGMSGHWIAGYGYNVDPGWGPRIDGRAYTDLVNYFIEHLARFGLIGFIPFILMNVAVVKRLVDAAKVSFYESDKWLVWCLAAGFCGLGAAMMSVSLFGEPTTVYYLMIGFAGVMPKLVSRPEGTLYNSYALRTGKGQ
jgi:hypothetical protein